ncbi:MAG: hypothetical protein LBJ74_02750 [Heliobacteriaceae bacterium]|jgi:hypothetical protein|nr:hypothetical protein [Heliobacteriaceae bacterium]
MKIFNAGKYRIMEAAKVLDNNGKPFVLNFDSAPSRINAAIFDNNGVCAGKCHSATDRFLNSIRTDVESEYKRRGLGIILRLTQVIHMLENNLESILTRPTLEALPFNEKLKFDYAADEYGIYMELPNKIVRKNHDFFNGLFEKHGLDYEI